MTLNDVIALILLISPNSITLQADYITVVEAVEGIPIMSVKYIVFQFQSSTFGQNYNAPCSAVSLR